MGVFAILYAVFYRELIILLVFALALLLAAVVHPVVNWLGIRAHLPRWASVVLVIVAILAAFVGLLSWVIPLLIGQAAQLLQALPGLFDRLRSGLTWLSRHFPVLTGGQAISLQQWVAAALGSLQQSVALLLELLAGLVLVIVVAIYTVATPVPLIRSLLILWPVEERDAAARAVDLAIQKVGVWMWAQLLAMASVGIMVGLATWFLGLPFPVVWGVLAGLVEILPTLGPIIGGLGPFLEALAVDPVRALWVVLVFIAIQQFENHVLVPLVIGRSLRLHPAGVVFAVVMMGALFGLLGVFIALPLMAIAQAIYIVTNETADEQRERTEEEARSALNMPPGAGGEGGGQGATV